MSDTLLPGEDLKICPNCRAVNHPNAVICIGCGIHLDVFEEIDHQLQVRQIEKTNARIDQLKQENNGIIKREAKHTRRMFIWQFVILIIITGVLISVAWGVAFLFDYRQTMKLQKLEDQYAQAEACIQEKNYLCACEIFGEIYQTDSNYRNIKYRLVDAKNLLADQYLAGGQITQAQLETEEILQIVPEDPAALQRAFNISCLLAEQYSASGRWQDAIAQLDRALEIRPGDEIASDQIKKIFNQWHQEALDDGNYLQAWWIKKALNSRFPENDSH